jgi:hydrogenase expression/formation protein HypC
MCLSVPAKILSIQGEYAEVSVGGTNFRACIQMIEEPMTGDYVLLHAGFAIQKISASEAAETLKLMDEMNDGYQSG